MARVLPPLLLDFFPVQEIMNKVIGEFLSSQQPHPELMAQVLFKVCVCIQWNVNGCAMIQDKTKKFKETNSSTQKYFSEA